MNSREIEVRTKFLYSCPYNKISSSATDPYYPSLTTLRLYVLILFP